MWKTTAVRAAGRVLARHRTSRLASAIGHLGYLLHLGYENCSDYDPLINGEAFVLRTLARVAAPRVLFDVGANVGAWSLLAAETCQTAAIHAFELVPSTYAQLQANAATEPRVRPHPFGLSNIDGVVSCKHYPAHPEISGLVDFPVEADHERLETSVRRGDDVVAALGVDRIDFLKIDVEGHEYAVLEGFRNTFRAGRIRAVQFEYGAAHIVSRTFLRDLYSFLAEFGFQVGKLYPTMVGFAPYRFQDEQFRGPNYIAVHNDDAALIAALSGR